MSVLAALPLIGDVLAKATGVIDELVEDKDLKRRLQSELTLRAMELDASAYEREVEARAQVLLAEATGESWLQRNWRPVLMLSFTAILVNNYMVVPVFRTAPMDMPPQMYDLLKIGVGGYVAGRSIEKGLKTWKGKA
ncbi:MAG: holin family protein [Gammaproteobacteria bacterium]|nr:holin family protein [Gammaproteobacteria bacterium]